MIFTVNSWQLEKVLNAKKVRKNYYSKAHLLNCCLTYDKHIKGIANDIRAELLHIRRGA